MKTLKLLGILLLFPLVFHAQRSLTGLWTGSLTNDSTTVRKDQSFEIALTQYKEKVYGYSRSAFIVNDTLFYVVKRVKGTINGTICEVKDEEIISYNFPGRIDKGVKVTYTFTLNQLDTTWQLAGNWKTNKTKNYYSIAGKTDLKEEKNIDNSKIFPHLEELNVANDVAFYKESKQPVPVIAATKTEAIKPTAKEKEKTKEPEVIAKKEKPVKKKEEPAVVKPTESVAKTQTLKTAAPTPNEPVKEVVKVTPPKKEEIVTTVVNPATAPAPVATAKPIIAAAAAFVAERKIAAPQIVAFASDSLELALYDNGEIDGDTVSVLLNNEVILAKQGLKASAIKKTIYVQPGTNEITLVLYAENLGKYPPNTGLLVVHDGEEVYQIRFSADLTQNAAIIFKRKGK
jgi:hypothetical protein